jgi:hypothetical protein
MVQSAKGESAKTYTAQQIADEAGKHLGSIFRDIKNNKLGAFKDAFGKFHISEDERQRFLAAQRKLTPANQRMVDCIKKCSPRDNQRFDAEGDAVADDEIDKYLIHASTEGARK